MAMSKLEKKLPNGHTLHNPGTEHEWESWKDAYGNTTHKDVKPDNKIIVHPVDENWWFSNVCVRCECPHCGEEIEVETGVNAFEENYCPMCDESFWVDLEN